MGPYHFLVGSLITPEDDFGQRLRKHTVAVFFCPGCLVALAYSVIAALDMAQSGTQYNITRFLQNFIQFTVILGVYLWMRKTHHVGDVQAAVLPWVGLLPYTAEFLNVPYSDNKTWAIVMALGAVFLQIAKLPIFLVVAVIYALVADWNVSHVHTNPGLLLVLPGYLNNREGSAIFTDAVFQTIFVSLAVVIFIFVVRESERRGAAQKAANEMTFNILKHQRKYDTQQVSRILLECRDAKVVDPELIKMFQEMNGNLESYRPFLPNYLFQAEDGEEDGGPREDLLQMAGSFPVNPLASDRRAADGTDLIDLVVESQQASSADSSVICYTDVERLTDVGSSSVNSDSNRAGSVDRRKPNRVWSASQLSTPEQKPQSTHFTGYISMAVVDIQVDRLLAALKFGGAGGARGAEATPLLAKKKPSLTPEINFLPTHGGGSQQHILHQHKASTVKTLVNMIYSIANETKASVHSLVGDTVQLSWNATHTISLPETKGALFLARLRKLFATRGGSKKTGATEDIIDNSHPSVAGAVCSGEATVHSIFSTTQHRSLVIDAPWLPALTGCFDLAKRHGAMLMDERTARGANLVVDRVAVEKIFYRHLPFCPAVTLEDEEFASVLSSGGGESRHPSPYQLLFHYPHRPGVVVRTPTSRVVPNPDLSQSSGSRSENNPSPSSSSLVFQILGEKTRQDNVEWMYQLDPSEHVSEGAARSPTGASPEPSSNKVVAVSQPQASSCSTAQRLQQQEIIEAVAEGRTQDASRMILVGESEPSSPLPGHETSKSRASPCAPTFRAAIIASIRTRADDFTASSGGPQQHTE